MIMGRKHYKMGDSKLPHSVASRAGRRRKKGKNKAEVGRQIERKHGKGWYEHRWVVIGEDRETSNKLTGNKSILSNNTAVFLSNTSSP